MPGSRVTRMDMPPVHTTTVSERLSRSFRAMCASVPSNSYSFSAASVSVLTTIGIVWILIFQSIDFFQHVPVWISSPDDATPLF